MYAVTRSALADAGLAIEDIDGIVVAANDQLDGRAISVMMASGSVGGVDRDILSTPSAAEHAFVLGAMRIASGQFRTQLVVSWSPTRGELGRRGAQARDRSVLPPRAAARRARGARRSRRRAARARGAGAARGGDRHRREEPRPRRAPPIPTVRRHRAEKVWIASGKPLRWPLTDAMVVPAGVRARGAGARGRGRSSTEHGIAERRPGSRAWAGRPSRASSGDRDLRAAARRSPRPRGRRTARPASRTPATAFRPRRSRRRHALPGAAGLRRARAVHARAVGGGARRAAASPAAARCRSTFPAARCRSTRCTAPAWCSIAEAANQVRGRAGSHQAKDVRTGARACRERLRDAIQHRRRDGSATGRVCGMSGTRVGIIGIGQSEFKPRRDDANYPELVREAVTLALPTRSASSPTWRRSCTRSRPMRCSASATPSGSAWTRSARATSASCASTPAARPGCRRWRSGMPTSPPARATSCWSPAATRSARAATRRPSSTRSGTRPTSGSCRSARSPCSRCRRCGRWTSTA